MKSKEEIRNKILNLRKKMDNDLAIKNSQVVINHLVSSKAFIKSTKIMTYLSYADEVHTDRLVLHSLSNGKDVAIPVCNTKSKSLTPSLINNLNMVEKGYFGLREPKKGLLNQLQPSQIDLIIVPGLAFDLEGNRIGHGAGYYDGFLKDIPANIPKIALAFQYQIIDLCWNVEPWDVPMDAIITEKGWVYKSSAI